MESCWNDTLYELIARASTDLPGDVEDALREASERESDGSNAAQALYMMLENVHLAREKRQPLCQDTGALVFWVDAPPSLSEETFHQHAEGAIVNATEQGLLRQNSVDPLTGENSGTNLGPGSPVIHWHEAAARDTVRVSLLLKGGGCENVGVQYSLPDARLGAGRDLNGVRRCALDATHRAQGRGCAPGVLGICIGGDRATGYAESKRQFLRPLGDPSDVPALADLERTVLREANTLGIGPMGFGGETTLLGVHIGYLNRLPASYFVSISYMCWSYRRHIIETDVHGQLIDATWRTS
ncbi:MAG: fumarate hydratase [Candidatus Pacebacteria bacterium]|nr:fumarate hydratase [Candidatus Paceibacterota bacterium]